MEKAFGMTSRLTLLSENGLPGLATSSIEPHRQGFGQWRIKFSYFDSEPLSMSSAQASSMASRLHQIGEAEMADEIDTAVARAQRYQTM
jgi:hypothetical protein